MRDATFSELSKLLGEHAARSLTHVFPGSRMWVPDADHLTVNHPLTTLLGGPLAHRMAELFGGDYLTIPTAHRHVNAMRDRQIFNKWKAGKTVRSISTTFGVAERTVYNTIKRMKEGTTT